MDKMKFLTFYLTVILIGIGITAESKSNESIRITPEEIKAVTKLREMLGDKLYKDYMRSDPFLVRWLRFGNGNIQTTKSKLENTLKWRLDNQIDGILSEDFTDLRKSCPYFISGHDKENSPILEFSMNQCSVRKLSLAGKVERLVRFVYRSAEALAITARSNITDNQFPEQVFSITDAQGFNAKDHACLACFPYYIAVHEAFHVHFPELFKTSFAINFSRSTEAILNRVFRSFMASEPDERHKIFGYDRNEWLPELLKYVDLDQLSPTFGGKAAKRLL